MSQQDTTFVIGLIVIVAAGITWDRFKRRCRTCGKWGAEKEIDRKKVEGKPTVIGEEERDEVQETTTERGRLSNPFLGDETYESRVERSRRRRYEIIETPAELVLRLRCKHDPAHSRTERAAMPASRTYRRIE